MVHHRNSVVFLTATTFFRLRIYTHRQSAERNQESAGAQKSSFTAATVDVATAAADTNSAEGRKELNKIIFIKATKENLSSLIIRCFN